ncbi:uncharacterized protein Dwil_GK10134 [Drosophila willistoni]|uniref:C2H2-type domain-containing protein n=1 Tax=Drosophila willistoni TaxID=7260 RepID=B4ND08_DROWI|nr:uncharacterized protein Dwil_GK10134 [Drosophila willistoni]
MSSPLQHGQDDENYAVSLEDVRLFAQLDDLNGDCDDLELLTPCNNFDLIDLVNGRRVHMKTEHSSQNQEQEQEQTKERDQDQKTIDSNLSYTCPICQRVLSDQCYLNVHLKRHYNQRDFQCPQPECSKRFFSSSELKHHQISHTQLRPFGCTKCQARFLRKSNYKQHMKIHERRH